MFHGSVQTLCIGCTARLDSAAPQEREELFRQMLDSPDLEDGERIRADPEHRKALSRLRRDAGAPAAEFLHRRGRLWGLTSLGLEQFEVDLYGLRQVPQSGAVCRRA